MQLQIFIHWSAATFKFKFGAKMLVTWTLEKVAPIYGRALIDALPKVLFVSDSAIFKNKMRENWISDECYAPVTSSCLIAAAPQEPTMAVVLSADYFADSAATGAHIFILCHVIYK